MDVAVVAAAALVTALATGLGAVPFAFGRSVTVRAAASGQAVAAGLMLSATLLLLVDGVPRGRLSTTLGVVAGGVLVVVLRRWMRVGRAARVTSGAPGAAHGLLIIVVMTAHSAAEGIGIGVSFANGAALAVPIVLAMAVHNIPEGVAISVVLVPAGSSVRRAALWSIASSLPQPVFAVPAFLLVRTMEPLVPGGLGFAAGAMLALAVTDLLPDAGRVLGGATTLRRAGAAFGALTVAQAALFA